MSYFPIFSLKNLFARSFFLISLSVAAADVGAQKSAIAVEDFFANPDVGQVELSPSGQHVAMLIATKLGRVQMATMSLADRTPKLIAGFSDADISQIHWVNDDRLVFGVADHNVAVGEKRFAQGLYAVNRDGSEFKQLVERVWGPAFTTGTTIKKRVMDASTSFYSLDYRKNSSKVFVVEPTWDLAYDLKSLRLMSVDTKTILTESFSGPGNTRSWLIDADGVPRVTVSVEDGIKKIYYRAANTAPWSKILEHDLYQNTEFSPLEFGPDGVLYVVATQDKDTTSLYRYDFEKNAVEKEPIVSVAGYDFHGDLIFDYSKKKLLGVSFLNDAHSTYWLDSEMKEVQRRVDEKLPATINQISIGRDGLSRFVIVMSYSDMQPVVYSSFDRETLKLDIIGGEYPKIDVSRMAMQDMVRFPARDGRQIPAYLTLPTGATKKNLPMVVLVHGGPYLRGTSWGWNAQVQFLASRGYAVLQPEFRGSTGFGFEHFQAGWKQWGLAMQDDIADAAKWAINTGVADPSRVCIAGGSYGGYATLMGLAKDADLFKCGIAWAAVTDIRLMYRENWGHDLSAEWQKYGMPLLIGDPVKDAEQLRETSPVNNTHKIARPLLLAHGGSDRRVPIEHGEIFYKAIKDKNPQVEWVSYLEEGHGWGLVGTRVDFWNKVEKFLQSQIGK